MFRFAFRQIVQARLHFPPDCCSLGCVLKLDVVSPQLHPASGILSEERSPHARVHMKACKHYLVFPMAFVFYRMTIMLNKRHLCFSSRVCVFSRAWSKWALSAKDLTPKAAIFGMAWHIAHASSGWWLIQWVLRWAVGPPCHQSSLVTYQGHYSKEEVFKGNWPFGLILIFTATLSLRARCHVNVITRGAISH